jgi:hypothetical protein
MKKSNVFSVELHELVIAGDESSFTSLFLVMELMPSDLKNLLNDSAN